MHASWYWLSCLCLLGLSSCVSSTDTPQRPPNIIWIISEDNSPFLGCYGDSLAHTPNLDRLAEQSVRIAHAYTHAPVCAPSRSALITGVYATELGTENMRCEFAIPDSIHFFPYYLRQQGYFTTNRKKKDYNIPDQAGVWDIDDWWKLDEALVGREAGQPFFLMFNTWMSHEGKMHGDDAESADYMRSAYEAITRDSIDEDLLATLLKRPTHVPPAPYHPDLPAVHEDWNRYYNRVSMMDYEVGLLLDQLEAQGLLDSSIVFYFSDHGGVLGRSKRFPFESGLRVPMLVHVPAAYAHLKMGEPGTVSERLVRFVDLAPTVLSLAGAELPPHLRGRAFMGTSTQSAPRYALGYRSRMDERIDLVRTISDGAYRYQRHYLPQRPYGQHVTYLWKAKHLPAWQAAYEAGTLSPVEAAFFEPRAAEALYHTAQDPHEIDNLIDDPAYEATAQRLRQALDSALAETQDLGFIPEIEVMRRAGTQAPHQWLRQQAVDWAAVKQMADEALLGQGLAPLRTGLTHAEPAVRYWAAIGTLLRGDSARLLLPELTALSQDPSPAVQLAVAEALAALGREDLARDILIGVFAVHWPILRDAQGPSAAYPYAGQVLTHAINVVARLATPGPALQSYLDQLIAWDGGQYAKRAAEWTGR
jgi:arylsulfatase A-like enzyme